MKAMSDAIMIRELDPSDRARFEEFFTDLGEFSTRMFNVGDGNKKLALSWFDGRAHGYAVFVAVEEKDGAQRICGYYFLWDLHTAVPWFGICVRDDSQGKGLGRALLVHAVEYARSGGYGGILLITNLENLRAQKLYESVGFERLGVEHTGREYQYVLRFAAK